MKKIGWSGLLIVSGLLFSLPAFSQQRWERNYGGASSDIGVSVQQTTDTGYIVAGGTYSFGNGWQVYLVKTNASGDTLWARNYGGVGHESGWSVQQTTDGGYIIVGTTTSFGDTLEDVYLIRTNATGDTLWTRAFGGTDIDIGYSVRQTTDTGYIIAGWSSSFGNSDQVYLIKTDSSGDTLWTKAYGGAGNDQGYSIRQTSEGGYIVAGIYDNWGSNPQVYLIKTNVSGDTLWTRNYGGTNYETGYSVQQTSDGGYIIGGYTNSFGSGYQLYLVKTNASGDTLWTKTYGGTGGDYGYSVRQTQDLGYIVAGYTGSFGNGFQVYLIKTYASGDTLWTRYYGGASSEEGYSVQQTQDGGYIVAGYTGSFGNGNQVYLIKTDVNGNVGVEDNSPGRIKPLTSNLSFSVIPNPFTSFASVPGHSSERFALYDISGRLVGKYKGDRIGAGLSAGVYFLKPDGMETKPLRVVKLR